MRWASLGCLAHVDLINAFNGMLPIFGLDLVLFGRVELVAAMWMAAIYIFMVRSASFATFATFAFNFLKARPLSSVAPLLFFCSWTLIFQPFVLAYQVNLQHLVLPFH